jgi:hypothetical protein
MPPHPMISTGVKLKWAKIIVRDNAVKWPFVIIYLFVLKPFYHVVSLLKYESESYKHFAGD